MNVILSRFPMAGLLLALVVAFFGGAPLLWVGSRIKRSCRREFADCLRTHMRSGVTAMIVLVIMVLLWALICYVAGASEKGRDISFRIFVAFALLAAACVYGRIATTSLQTPFLYNAAVGAGTYLVFAMLMYYGTDIGMAQEFARRADCKNHLRAIGKAMDRYAKSHDGAFPPTLETLVSASELDPGTLRCPSSQEKRQSDYFYLPPSERGDPNTQVIACDFRMNHGNCRNILFADFQVSDSLDDPNSFQDWLVSSGNAAFAKALRAAEGP